MSIFGDTDNLFWTFGDGSLVSKPEWAALSMLSRSIHDIHSWDSSLVWHLCQMFCWTINLLLGCQTHMYSATAIRLYNAILFWGWIIVWRLWSTIISPSQNVFQNNGLLKVRNSCLASNKELWNCIDQCGSKKANTSCRSKELLGHYS